MTAGPADRLLAAVCSVIAGGFGAGELDCAVHDGRFENKELSRFEVTPPAVRVASLGVASTSNDGQAATIDYRLVAAAIGWDEGGERRGEMARRIADRVAFELAGPRNWARAVFNPDGLDRDDPHNPLSNDWPGGSRGSDVSCPREIRAANLYESDDDDKDSVVIWAVTWLQKFRAREEDFDFDPPSPAGIPDEVLSARAPQIGAPHRDAYDRVVPQELA